MHGNCKVGALAEFSKDSVAAYLTTHEPASLLEGFNRILAGDVAEFPPTVDLVTLLHHKILHQNLCKLPHALCKLWIVWKFRSQPVTKQLPTTGNFRQAEHLLLSDLLPRASR